VDLKDIKKIVELMNEHELSYFHLEKEEFNLKLKKGADAEAIQAAMVSMPQQQVVQAAPAAAPQVTASAPATSEATATNGEEITSPMVGTFYTKPAPDADNFVKVGDTISKGQTLCIVEAMKVMNEIEAEVSGTITAILVEDGTPVQFGDPLFSIK